MSTEPAPPVRRRLRLSLRVMMLLVLVLGLWMARQVKKARAQREAVAAVKKFGGWVHYDYEFANGKVTVAPGNDLWGPGWGKLTRGRSPRAPAWLRRIAGDEYFQDIAHVSLFVDIAAGSATSTLWNIGPADDVLAKLEGQAGIKTLQIGGQQATDRGMRHLRGMTGLEELIVWPAGEITDAGVAHLRGMENLKRVFIADSRMTDEGLRHLAGLPKVEHLKLQGHRFSDKGLAYLKGATRLKTLMVGSERNEISDAGMATLKGLTSLELLDLQGSKVTDRGLETLEGLANLKVLHVGGTPITKEAKARFKAALPNLKTLD